MLDFVDDRRRAELAQESPRVALGSIADVERVQADVRHLGAVEERLAERRLAGLARPGHRHERVLPEQLQHEIGNLATNHADMIAE